MVWSGGHERLLGKYQIIQPIKTGGTAAVYLALMHGENQFTREVVIKRPLPHLLADERFRGMFIDEARVQSRLAHPNIVQVLDLVSEGNEVYLVLEYLSGRDLREIAAHLAELGRRAPVDVAVYLIAEVAAGLHHAHEARGPDGAPLNLIHRDISPKNIRITDRGAVKLIDFGIARFDDRLTETRDGAVKGTLGYMAPEQLMGEEVDRRADLFALGICLFQLLSGENPFHAGSLKERVQKLVHDPIPRLAELGGPSDERLEAIVARCLARDPGERYANAEALERDLRQALLGFGIASPRERVVHLLEELYPDIHEPPGALREALTGISRTKRAADRKEVASNLGTEVAEAREIVAPLPRTVPDMRQPRPRRERALVLGLAVAVLGAGVGWTLFEPAAPRTAALPDAGFAAPEVPDAAPVAVVLEVPKPEDAGARVPPTDPPPRPRPALEGPSPREYLRAGAALAKDGQGEDALLLYRLAYAASRGAVDPSIYKNLGIELRRRGDGSKMRACLSLYLSSVPRPRDADEVAALLAAFPPSGPAPCVSDAEVAAATKRAARLGAKIRGWIDAAR